MIHTNGSYHRYWMVHVDFSLTTVQILSHPTICTCFGLVHDISVVAPLHFLLWLLFWTYPNIIFLNNTCQWVLRQVWNGSCWLFIDYQTVFTPCNCMWFAWFDFDDFSVLFYLQIICEIDQNDNAQITQYKIVLCQDVHEHNHCSLMSMTCTHPFVKGRATSVCHRPVNNWHSNLCNDVNFFVSQQTQAKKPPFNNYVGLWTKINNFHYNIDGLYTSILTEPQVRVIPCQKLYLPICVMMWFFCMTTKLRPRKLHSTVMLSSEQK